jgi:hypothetical protein
MTSTPGASEHIDRAASSSMPAARLRFVGGMATLCIAGAWMTPAVGVTVVPMASVSALPAAGGADGTDAGSGSDGAGGGAGSGAVSSPCGDGACGHGPSASGSAGSGGSGGAVASGGGSSSQVQESSNNAVAQSVGDSGGFLGWLKSLFSGSTAAPATAGSGSGGAAAGHAPEPAKDGGDVPADQLPQDGPLAQHAADAAASTSSDGKGKGDAGFGGNVGSGASLPDSGGVGGLVSSIMSSVSAMVERIVS